MKQYKSILFDLDGTLLDTLQDLHNSVNFALRKNGLPERSFEHTRLSVGNGILRLIQLSVPEGTSEEQLQTTFADFKAHYAEHDLDNTAPYPGIPEALAELKKAGYRMGVVSNKVDFAVQNLNKVFFGLHVAVGERDGIPRKPQPDMIRLALRELGADPETTVYVGDSEVDIQTAKNAGLDCLSVTWGFRDVPTLQAAGATTLIDTPEALAAYLCKVKDSFT